MENIKIEFKTLIKNYKSILAPKKKPVPHTHTKINSAHWHIKVTATEET